MAKKKSASIGESVAAIHAHLTEVFPHHKTPAPASAEDLEQLANAAGAPLTDELIEFYGAADGIELPEPVPELQSLLSAREARDETLKAREPAETPALVVLEHQDYESSIRAVALSGDSEGKLTRWDSVEAHFDDYDDTTVAKHLAAYLKTLQESVPTPKQLKVAVARVVKAGRAKDIRGINTLFERSGRPARLLRAVLESEPEATTWINTEYNDNVLDRPLRAHSDELPIALLVEVASKLPFAGTVTLLAGTSPLTHHLLALAYLRNPEETTAAAAALSGTAKDCWLLLQRRMGTIPASAISDELRKRLAASPRKYQVYTPQGGRLVGSSVEGLGGLDPYFDSRQDVIAAIRKAPLSSCSGGEIVAIHLADATTAAHVAAIADAAWNEAAGVDDAVWHQVPFRMLVDAAKQTSTGDWLAWVSVSHPDASPAVLEELAAVMKPPDDAQELKRLPPNLAAAISRKAN